MDDEFYGAAFRRWQSIAKPLGGLGLLEDFVCRIAQIQRTRSPDISKRVLAVFCADNGIVSAGVSQSDSSVTKIVARNIALGKTSVTNMARIARCDVLAVDCGIKRDEDEFIPGCVDFRVGNGSENFLERDAMTRGQCEKAIQNGMMLASDLKQKGYAIFSTGEMGIGNTTTASAVLSALLGCPVEEVTGKGAGLSDDGLSRKIDVIRRGIALRKPDASDAVDVLSKVGGFDIATMCGFFAGAARERVPCVVDGFISAVSALCAVRLFPQTRGALLASHKSSEPGGKVALDALGLDAPIDCRMHLGEGTGCMTLLPLLDMALSVFYGMPTFSDISIEPYKPL